MSKCSCFELQCNKTQSDSQSRSFRGRKFMPNLCTVCIENGRSLNNYAYFEHLLNCCLCVCVCVYFVWLPHMNVVKRTKFAFALWRNKLIAFALGMKVRNGLFSQTHLLSFLCILGCDFTVLSTFQIQHFRLIAKLYFWLKENALIEGLVKHSKLLTFREISFFLYQLKNNQTPHWNV